MSQTQDLLGLPHSERIRELTRRVESLESTLERVLHARRDVQQTPPDRVMWAQTIANGTYPGYTSLVFPVVFLDPAFDPTEGADGDLLEDRGWSKRSATHQSFALSREWVPEGAVVPVWEQWRLHFLETPGLKPLIRFRLASSLAVTDEKVSGTIQLQAGSGLEHDAGTVTLYNHPVSYAQYLFHGPSNAWGWAAYRQYASVSATIERQFDILSLECPE